MDLNVSEINGIYKKNINFKSEIKEEAKDNTPVKEEEKSFYERNKKAIIALGVIGAAAIALGTHHCLKNKHTEKLSEAAGDAASDAVGKAQEKVNNKPIDLDTNKEKEPDDLSDFFNMVNALSKSDDLIDSKQKIDNTADMFKDSFNPSMDVNTIPSNNPSVEIPNPVIPTESVEKVNVASDIPKVVKDATIVNEIPTEKKNEDLISSDKLKFSSPFGGSIDELMKPNSEPVVSNSNINNNDNFIREDKELKEVIDTNNIEKPKINVDADSIIVNQNVTDDQFFDDFFGD